MQISTEKQRILSDMIALLSAEHASGQDLRTAIGASLLDLLDADFYASYAWNARKKVGIGRGAPPRVKVQEL